MAIANLIAELLPVILIALAIALIVWRKAGRAWAAGTFVVALAGLVLVQTVALDHAQRIAATARHG